MGRVARAVGFAAGALLMVASMTVGLGRWRTLRPAPRVALAVWQPGCFPLSAGQVAAHEESRQLRRRLAAAVPLERRPDPRPAMVPLAAEVCLRSDGAVRSVDPDRSALTTRAILSFERTVRSWRFAPGPARCYRDRFWVGAGP
jgi:hypothetical protein